MMLGHWQIHLDSGHVLIELPMRPSREEYEDICELFEIIKRATLRRVEEQERHAAERPASEREEA